MTDKPELTTAETINCIFSGQIDQKRFKVEHLKRMDRHDNIKLISEAYPSELYKSIKAFHTQVVGFQTFYRKFKDDCPDDYVWENISEEFGKKIQEHIDKLEKMKYMIDCRVKEFKRIDSEIYALESDIKSLNSSKDFYLKELVKSHNP